MVCNDCLAEQRRRPLNRGSITTRASYRAKLRIRQASPQRDLVDMLVMTP